MRDIKYIVIHCSATKEGVPFTAADIDRWHKQRGFSCIGYHYVIDLDGRVELGRPVSEPGAHCVVPGKRINKESIGICYIGGLDEDARPRDTRTTEQKKALSILVRELKASFPGAEVVGHRDLFADINGDGIVDKQDWLKACPCFDVRKEFR